jgi:NADH:ubiquinone oxidoreductase subunit 2 (subunit N)
MLIRERRSIALENSLKYFLIQRVASLWFIFSCLLRAFTGLGSTPFIATLAIALKLGIAPFHGWFISIMSSASFSIIFILSTVQKFIPLLIMRIFPGSGLMVKVLVLVTLFSVFSLGLAQVSVKKIFAVSSINNVR